MIRDAGMPMKGISLNKGFTHVTLIDISPSLCEAISSKLFAFIGRSLTVICDDFFQLEGRYGLVLCEHFCALDPSVAIPVCTKCNEILEPGELAGYCLTAALKVDRRLAEIRKSTGIYSKPLIFG